MPAVTSFSSQILTSQRRRREGARAARAALIAARVARTLRPVTVLDFGRDDALAEQLAEIGIAVDHVTVGADADDGPLAVPEPPAGASWDLVTCLDVLETLPSVRAEDVLEQAARSADRLLASYGTAIYPDTTGAAVRTPAGWAAGLAERGMFRRTDLDVEFAGPWTAVFERSAVTARDLVHRYEQALSAATGELIGANILHRPAGGEPTPAAHSEVEAQLRREVDQLKHEALASRDFLIGAEAEVAELRAQVLRERAALAEVYSSQTWRLGARIARPLVRARQALGPKV
ncbi:MAG TPA: hypothetical protein VK816_06200 [Jatrophihabitantaceae bacterium]|jgi:hypothetical protein|nr:hypothetical protein [Jatrophihabitantaceae bacterium]